MGQVRRLDLCRPFLSLSFEISRILFPSSRTRRFPHLKALPILFSIFFKTAISGMFL